MQRDLSKQSGIDFEKKKYSRACPVQQARRRGGLGPTPTTLVFAAISLTTMSAQNSRGIQTLLEAERKAHEIVQNARSYRAQRLKASKADAAKEIEEYKKTKEAEFQANESKVSRNRPSCNLSVISLTLNQHTGDSSKAQEAADAQVAKELEDVKSKSAASKASVVDKLIDSVTTPKPTLHINAV